jgi:hypothetical protein
MVRVESYLRKEPATWGLVGQVVIAFGKPLQEHAKNGGSPRAFLQSFEPAALASGPPHRIVPHIFIK